MRLPLTLNRRPECFVKMDDMENPVSTKLEFSNVNMLELLNFCFLIFDTRQMNDPNKKNLKIVKVIDPSTPKNIFTHDTKLKQVIINLMSNAYKFTPAGEVRLVYQFKKKENDKNFVRIRIEDDGDGLTKDEQDKLFKPFSQIGRNQNMNMNGSGLGLLIVKDTLSLLESNINVESELHKGSCFYFDLELDQVPQSPEFSRKSHKIPSIETLAIEPCFFLDENIQGEFLRKGFLGNNNKFIYLYYRFRRFFV